MKVKRDGLYMYEPPGRKVNALGYHNESDDILREICSPYSNVDRD